MATRTRSTNGHEHRFSQENLSAYIDQQLTASDRARVERHLQACEACQQELAALRRTIALVSQAPRVHAPRSFALPRTMQPVQARQRRWEGLFAVARTAAVVASALMLVFFAGDMALTLGWSPVGTAQSSAPNAAPVSTELVERVVEEEPAMMLEALPAAEEPAAEKQVEAEAEQAVAAVVEAAELAPEEAPVQAERASEPESEAVAMRVLPTPDPRTPNVVDGMGGGGPIEVAGMAPPPEIESTVEARDQQVQAAEAVEGIAAATATSEPTPRPATATATPTSAPPTPEPTPTERPTSLPPTPEPEIEPPTAPEQAVAAAAEPAPTDTVGDYGIAVGQPRWQLWGWLRTIWMLAAGLLLILLGTLVWAAYRKRL